MGAKTDSNSEPENIQRLISDAVSKATEAMAAQLNKLTAAVAQLTSLHNSSALVHQTQPSAALSATAPLFIPQKYHTQPTTVPKKPCPRCGERRHWASPSPKPYATSGACFHCGQAGHRACECSAQSGHLNPHGPMLGPQINSNPEGAAVSHS